MKTVLTTNLSTKSIQNLKNNLENLKNNLDKGCENFVEYATQRFYELVCQNCANTGRFKTLSDRVGQIHYEYDKTTKIGRVWSNDKVIYFNEFGTGIKGKPDEWATQHGYQVNASGKGAEGWWYPTDESDPNPYKWPDENGQLRALTHGLESGHMFYDSLLQLQSEYGEMIEITIGKALGETNGNNNN